MNIAYFGFAANPPQLGHREVIEWLAERFDLVLVCPSVAHAFGKNLPELDIRDKMCAAMLSHVTAPNVKQVDIERQLYNGGPVYSYDVLVALQKQYPSADLYLAIGPDNAVPETWSRFYRADDIVAEFNRVIAPDMGIHKRSTQVRKMLQEGTTRDELIKVIPAAVADLIVSMPELYGAVKVK